MLRRVQIDVEVLMYVFITFLSFEGEEGVQNNDKIVFAFKGKTDVGVAVREKLTGWISNAGTKLSSLFIMYHYLYLQLVFQNL